MKSIKTIMGSVAAGMSIPLFLHKTFYRNNLTILMYHGVINKPLEVSDWCFISSEEFTRQMLYVKKHFDVISLSDATNYLKNTNAKTDRPKLVITFDDGYQNNFDVAFPILQNLNIPATIFVNTKYVDTDESIWFCMLNVALQRSKKNSMEWANIKYDISSPEAKAKTSASLQAILKEGKHFDLVKSLHDIGAILGYEISSSLNNDSPFYILSSDAIKIMKKSGLIEFGAHTATHTILSRVDAATQEQEINKSIQDIESITGEKCRFFSYPNGRRNDYNSNAINQLVRANILASVTTVNGPNTCETPLLELKRYGVGLDTSMTLFKCMAHHFTVKVDDFLDRIKSRKVDINNKAIN